jgi:hypothetical protein
VRIHASSEAVEPALAVVRDVPRGSANCRWSTIDAPSRWRIVATNTSAAPAAYSSSVEMTATRVQPS